MISPTFAKWGSRILVTFAILLFLSTFAYLATRNGPTTIGPDGEKSTSLSTAEWHTAILLFCSTGWSFCALFAWKAIGSSSTAARALLRALQPVGLGIFAATFLPALSGNMGLSVTLALSGFALAGLSQLLYFAFFGAKETFERVQDGVAEVKNQIQRASDAPVPFAPPATFLPEAQPGWNPSPVVESPPPTWSPPPPPPVVPPPPTWSPPPPPAFGPPPGSGSSWQ